MAKQGIPNGDPAKIEQSCQEFFTQFDTNGDGKVQKSEWLDFFGKMFDGVIAATM